MRKFATFAAVSLVCFGLLVVSIIFNLDNLTNRPDNEELVSVADTQEDTDLAAIFGLGSLNPSEERPSNGAMIAFSLRSFPLYHFRADLQKVHHKITHLSQMITPTDYWLHIVKQDGNIMNASIGGSILEDFSREFSFVDFDPTLWHLRRFDDYLNIYLQSGGTMEDLKLVHDTMPGGRVRIFLLSGNYDLIEIAPLEIETPPVAFIRQSSSTGWPMGEETARNIILDNIGESIARDLNYQSLLIRNDSLFRLYNLHYLGTTPPEPAADRINYPPSGDVQMSITYHEQYNSHMIATIINNTPNVVEINWRMDMERFNGEFWETTEGPAAFAAASHHMLSGEIMDFVVDLERFPTQKTGLFRIRRLLFEGDQRIIHDITAEFYRH
ncbi:MAG: hypothetical protein FWC93_02135 [Defluviitaleaceae bacterium]|nr:hypothetical protein [Defluviitaleaceae bacterium]